MAVITKTSLKTQVINFLAAHGPATIGQIKAAIFPIRFGRPYNPISDRGYYTDRFYSYQEDYFYRPSKADPRYIMWDRQAHKFYTKFTA